MSSANELYTTCRQKIDDEQKTVSIVHVGHRKDVYDSFRRFFMTFDPRNFGTPVYNLLVALRDQTRDLAKLKKQKSMAQELYTYLSTWGLMRLKAEEVILSDGREEPVRKFFNCLAEISGRPNLNLETLKNLDADEYLGLTGLGLEIAREFSFWVSAIYHDVSGDD